MGGNPIAQLSHDVHRRVADRDVTVLGQLKNRFEHLRHDLILLRVEVPGDALHDEER